MAGVAEETLGRTQADPFDGDIARLADRIRRHPEIVREIAVHSLVLRMARHWRTADDMLEVTGEVPVTAWIVRRKAEGVLGLENPAGAEDDVAASASAAAWLTSGREILQDLIQSRGLRWGRPAIWPGPVRIPVKDPSLGKLRAAWPPVRSRPISSPQVIEADPDPLEGRIADLRQRLRQSRQPLRLASLVLDSGHLVSHFLAIVHLWHWGEAEVEQARPYAEVWIRRGEDVGG
ncbi:MAG: hypothetical protein M0Z53_04765 [Thermaerobacter sp.]|nr:hypothetical protein [Thermaerobacter sp.]